mgnify:CR=1 FL=1
MAIKVANNQSLTAITALPSAVSSLVFLCLFKNLAIAFMMRALGCLAGRPQAYRSCAFSLLCLRLLKHRPLIHMAVVPNAAVISCSRRPGPLDRQPPVITRGCLCFLPGTRLVRRFGRRPYISSAAHAEPREY